MLSDLSGPSAQTNESKAGENTWIADKYWRIGTS